MFGPPWTSEHRHVPRMPVHKSGPGCNKDSEQFFFFFSKKHRIRSSLHLTACVFNNRCVSSVCFSFFFTSLMKESMITVRLQYYINSARALLLAAEVTRVFFSSTLFPAHTFLILILQTASYTHADWRWSLEGAVFSDRLGYYTQS